MRYSSIKTSELVRLIDKLADTAEHDDVLVDRALLTEIAERLHALDAEIVGLEESDPRQLRLF